MNTICITGAVLYVLALVCGLLSRRWTGLCWVSCIVSIVSAGMLLYEGAPMEILAAGALGLALPLVLIRGREQETT